MSSVLVINMDLVHVLYRASSSIEKILGRELNRSKNYVTETLGIISINIHRSTENKRE